MQLSLPRAGLEKYKSNSQRARIATEAWGTKNLYCLNCDSDELSCSPPNTAAIDYVCSECDASFQLKSQSRLFGTRINDAAYAAMLQKIRADETPNLIALYYDLASWRVENAFLVPHFAFSISAIEKRPPLASTARRAGWVGCNILLTEIPPDARIPPLVTSHSPLFSNSFLSVFYFLSNCIFYLQLCCLYDKLLPRLSASAALRSVVAANLT